MFKNLHKLPGPEQYQICDNTKNETSSKKLEAGPDNNNATFKLNA